MLGHGHEHELHLPRAAKIVDYSTYLGVAPEITTVLYTPGDHVGLICAIASLIPIFICVALFTAFLCRRTALDLWVGGGQIICELINGIIKVIIQQPRPSSPISNLPADSYGMPSAHAQYMGYFAAIVTVQTLRSITLTKFYKAVRITAATAVSVFTAYSRYYLYYHSGEQVTIGYLVGTALGLMWLPLFAYVRKIGLVKWGLLLWPCKMFMVKDTEYNVFEEYQEYLKTIGEEAIKKVQ